jgi:integrase
VPLKRLFEWLKKENLYAGPEADFRESSDELMAVLPRDRFDDDEILRFVAAPLFTRCAGRTRIWQPGEYFDQGDLYWIFLILMFTGMRTAEPPQIKLDDIVSLTETHENGSVEVFHFINMRPYDPARGRKPIRELKHLKRSDFARILPVHRLLIELGLLERVERLRAVGETSLFPGWEAHKSASDEVRWGKRISRAFDHGRNAKGVEREHLRLRAAASGRRLA